MVCLPKSYSLFFLLSFYLVYLLISLSRVFILSIIYRCLKAWSFSPWRKLCLKYETDLLYVGVCLWLLGDTKESMGVLTFSSIISRNLFLHLADCSDFSMFWSMVCYILAFIYSFKYALSSSVIWYSVSSYVKHERFNFSTRF